MRIYKMQINTLHRNEHTEQ